MTRSSGETIREIAPRLARAHAAERAYRERRAFYRRRGVMPIDVAMEEMIRGVRLGNQFRSSMKQLRRILNGEES